MLMLLIGAVMLLSWPSGVPKNMTAAERVERAKKAAAYRASAEGLIKALSKKPLTIEQRTQLAALLLRFEDPDEASA
jgi:hypothetical protein